MKKVYLLVFGGVLGVCFGSYAVTAQETGIAQNSIAQYSFEDYRKECLQRANQQGLARDSANDLCGCTITKIRSQYTIQQFRSLVQKSKTDRTVARQLSSIGEACLDTVLYEE